MKSVLAFSRGARSDAVFVQVGSARHAYECTAGLSWEGAKSWDLESGKLSGYSAVSMSEWTYPAPDGRRTAWLGRLGLIPVLRYRPSEGTSRWFIEAGAGITATTTVHETERKSFSTGFDFGDHLAIGRSFGVSKQRELAPRLEHFSNAGIKHPKPGENFARLRYSYHF